MAGPRDEDPTAYLTALARGDARLEGLLGHALRRPLRHLRTLPPGPSVRGESDAAEHVRDWLLADLAEEAHWIDRVDAEGVPVKLAKLATLEQASREADKAMRRRLSKGPSGAADPAAGTTLEAALADGWTVVRLTTAAALDAESSEMQHCIGHGSYDARLDDGDSVFLSLRDPAGRPHVTIEADPHTMELLQIRGKQNEPPVAAHARRIRPFVAARLRVTNDLSASTRLVVDADGRVHDLDDLPDELRVPGDLDLSAFDGRLPLRLEVGGTLHLPRSLPDGVLDCEVVTGGDLYVEGGDLVRFARPARVGRKLTVKDVPVVDLNEDTRVGRSLFLANLPALTALPAGIAAAGDGVLKGHVVLDRTGVRSLDGVFAAVGSLALAECPIASLPDGLEIRGETEIVRCPLSSLPSSVRFLGDVRWAGNDLGRVERNRFGGRLELSCDTRPSAWPPPRLPNAAMAPGIEVRGNLVLAAVLMDEGLPSDLKVGGGLEVRAGRLGRGPGGVAVRGNVHVESVAGALLPPGFACGGDLRLRTGSCGTLGHDTAVEGDLVLEDAMGPLPAGLAVGGDLDLSGLSPDDVPDDLVVRGRLLRPAERRPGA